VANGVNKIKLSYCEVEALDHIEEGEWCDQGKFQTQDNIVQYNDKFYRYSIERSGNYWNGYQYTHEFSDLGNDTIIELVEVVKKPIMVYEWVAV
jgi:hypothetical protein